MKRRKTTYNGITFDSPDELDLYYWAEQAEQAGLIDRFEYQNPTWTLSEPVTQEIARFGKSGKPLKPKTVTLLRGASYTCDFHFIGADDLIPEFVDVKPTFTVMASTERLFSVTRKWLYQKHGVLVQPVVPKRLFTRTFVPDKCRLTAKTRQPRKVYCELPTMKEFIARESKDERS